MQKHPFIEFIPYRIVGIILVLTAWGILSCLEVLYCGMDWEIALIDSLITTGILSAAGFLLWYVTDVLRASQAQFVLALAVQVICIADSFIIWTFYMENPGMYFLPSIPLRLLFGLSCWFILLQWYRIYQMHSRIEEEPDRTDEIDTEEQTPAVAQTEELPDRISVKDGTRIHIIHLDELFYIQACGDYVTLFTPTGQYTKEQTMKYFETHLPLNIFIRIHRSCIVNSEQIVRVELFGKETYQVRLKNGICLRASNSGYKLLKERLLL